MPGSKKIWIYQGTNLVSVTEGTNRKSPEAVSSFIYALAAHGNVTRACRESGVPRLTVYYWREHDEEFRILWDSAKEVAKGALEDEALRRAFEGINEPVVHQGALSYEMEPLLEDDGTPVLEKGQVVMVPRRDADGQPIPLTIKKYSDSLAQFMLRALDPETYRDRTDVRVTDTGLGEKLKAARRRLAARDAGGSPPD